MEFSKQFIEIVNLLADKVGIVIDWGSKKVIPYIQDLGGRLVNYEIVTSIAWIIIALSITAILWTLFIRFDEEELFLGIVLVVTLVAVFVVGIQVFDIIGVLTIPEKIIYDMINIYMK